MDACSRILRLCAGVLPILLVGCQGLNWPFQPHAQPPLAQEPPAAVPAAASQPAPGVEDGAEPMAIERWARQLAQRDDVRSRIARRPAQPVEPSRTPMEIAADAEHDPAPASQPQSQPAATPAALTGSTSSNAAADAAPTAPRLIRVDVPPQPLPRDPSKTTDASVELNAPAAATMSPATLREFLESLPPAGPGDALRDQLQQRLLWALAGDDAKARSPLTLASKEQGEICSRFVDAIIAIRDLRGSQPSAEIAAALRPLQDLTESLSRAGELKLPTVAVCRAVRGFGQYDPIEPPQFVAGRANEFVLYAELRDFVSEQCDGGGFRSLFGLKVAVLSRAGDVVHELAVEEMVDQCRARRADCFVSPLIRLPQSLAPGEYVVKITLSDKIGRKVAEKRTTIALHAR